MSRLTFLFIVILNFPILPQSVLAQSIQCEEQNVCGYFSANVEYNFYLTNGKPSSWSFSVLDKDGKLDNIYNTEGVGFKVKIDEDNTDWTECERFYTLNGDSCFYKGYIINNTYKDTLSVKLLLVPSKPLIRNIELKYDGYDFSYHELINPLLSLNIKSDSLVRVGILQTDFNETTLDDNIYFTYGSYLDFSRDGDDICIDGISCDVNQWICFFASNSFGLSVLSDTILTNSLIKDTDILNDLNGVTPIGTLSYKQQQIPYIIDSGILKIVKEGISELFVYGFSGQLYAHLRNPEVGYAYQLPKGVCLLKLINDGIIFLYKVHI